MTRRRYKLSKRATQAEETRRRIVEATGELHAEVGPAATTISAIAERAGVQRLTVYRHFPEPKQLFEACSALSEERHPSPDPEQWQSITDPHARTLAALTALYRYYAADAKGLQLVLHDAAVLPDLQETLNPFTEYIRGIADDLADNWSAAKPAPQLRAAASLAVNFSTWRTLADSGVGPDEAAGLVTVMVAAVADSSVA